MDHKSARGRKRSRNFTLVANKPPPTSQVALQDAVRIEEGLSFKICLNITTLVDAQQVVEEQRQEVVTAFELVIKVTAPSASSTQEEFKDASCNSRLQCYNGRRCCGVHTDDNGWALVTAAVFATAAQGRSNWYCLSCVAKQATAQLRLDSGRRSGNSNSNT